MRLVRNPHAAPRQSPYSGRAAAALPPAAFAEAEREIANWPGYVATPVIALERLAAELGLGAILYKDESGRFGLGSFKPLGGAYAVLRVLARELRRRGIVEDVTAADLLAGRWRAAVADITVASATDGNHGRAVAWGASLFGCRAVIVIHEHVSEGRKTAIERFGATVVRVPGSYDDSVRYAFAEAQRQGWHVVQDTSVGDYREVPRDITAGYGVVAGEAMRQLAEPPTHVIVPAGVGGLASAVAARFWIGWGERRPVFVTLEPSQADCVFRSLAAGHPVEVTGDIDSVMAGLSCGVVSELAFDVLRDAADAAIALEDRWAIAGMQRLARPVAGDPPIVGGECAGGAIGALLALAAEPGLRREIALDDRSRVLLIGTEGATDPEIYERLVGAPPA
jgi:diaminopropionate ammonia-lyase